MDCNSKIESKILNSHLLANVFGAFPCFHDAEVIQISLDRPGDSKSAPRLDAAIRLYEMERVDAENLTIKADVLARFRFTALEKLNLDGFNNQNVINDLIIEDLPKGSTSKLSVFFEGIYGIDLTFECNSVCIESVEPWEHK